MQAESTPSYVCLRYAAWTMAAALSSQFRGISRNLYYATLEKLKAFNFTPTMPMSRTDPGKHDEPMLAVNEASYLDQAQAWILIAVYELMQNAFQPAWASAGRAIRLVQFMRLNSLDASDDTVAASAVAYLEEKRRTFWMAFCLDRYTCVLGDLPLTLSEHLVSGTPFNLTAPKRRTPTCILQISTRLPSPEQAFQGGVAFQMPFFSELIDGNKPHDGSNASLSTSSSSPFVECIIFTALWGRGLVHYQQARIKNNIQGSLAHDFCDRHLALDNILFNEFVRLQQSYCPESMLSDPTLLFTQMVAEATAVSLYMAAELMTKGSEGYADFVAPYRKKAHAAAKSIAGLADRLLRHSLFKVITRSACVVFRQGFLVLRYT